MVPRDWMPMPMPEPLSLATSCEMNATSEVREDAHDPYFQALLFDARHDFTQHSRVGYFGDGALRELVTEGRR